MLFTQSELEEMSGFTLEELDLDLFETSNEFLEFDLDTSDFSKLFERVRELTFEQAREQFSYQQQYEQYGV
jgi:hypothetical protein